MPTRYISTKTAYLYNNATGSSRRMVLIYGDRVSVNGTPDPASNARISASFRGQAGFVKQNQLQSSKPMELYFIDVGDASIELEVLGPHYDTLADGSAVLRWFDSGDEKHSHTINGHSVVLRLNYMDISVSASNVVARKIFKQRLPELINVRTDGHDFYAARRVNQGYWWESYGPMPAAQHPSVFS